jgi:hypothetical protein
MFFGRGKKAPLAELRHQQVEALKSAFPAARAVNTVSSLFIAIIVRRHKLRKVSESVHRLGTGRFRVRYPYPLCIAIGAPTNHPAPAIPGDPAK